MFGTPSPIHNPLVPSYEMGKVISGLVGLLILVGAIFAFIYFIIGGLNWITSGGDKARIESARNRIINALVGLIIIASVWAIVSLIFPILGLSFPQITLPSIGRGLSRLTP